MLTSGLPEAGYSEVVEDCVGTYQCQALEERLGCKHSIEWVLMRIGKQTAQAGVA